MKPAENTKRLIKNARIKINPEVKKAALKQLINELEKSKTTSSTATKPNIWRIIIKNRITQVAALFTLLFALSVFTLNDKHQLRQNETKITEISETPAELLNAFSLNMAFRDDGIEGVMKKFRQAEEKVKRGLNERLTIDQLICELEECEKI